MSWLNRVLIVGFLAVVAAAPAYAQTKLKVVTSTPELKSLTEAVGSDRVEVESLARGWQNFHDVEVRPSLMVKLRRADLLVINGLDLDYWVDALVQGANNPKLLLGGPGRVDASRGVQVREVPTGPIDRSMGDVHPAGNPHYTLDPETAPIVTANVLDGLTRLTPDQRDFFEGRRAEFLQRLQAAQVRWHQTLERFKGAKVVVYHNTWIYFLSRFGLTQAGTVEDRPGIPPSPTHLANLIRRMKDDRIRVLILDPWGDRKLAERLATEAGARVVVLAHSVGALKRTDSYLEMIEHNVNALAGAFGPS